MNAKRICRIGAVAFVIALAGAGEQSFGQSLGELRSGVRQFLSDSRFAASFSGLVALSDEFELSGATYQIGGPARTDNSDTELSTLALPFRQRFHPWEDAAISIYSEGVLGYAQAHERWNDIYGGLLPGLATSLNTDWTTYGGLFGVGPEFRVSDQFRIAPILNVGVARIENHADYGGPGAASSAALFDGLAFNWNGWTVSRGGAARAEWDHPLGKDYELQVVGRYDLRWTQTFATDDRAQEFSDRLQLATLRADVVGPTGLKPFGRTLDWRTLAGYRHFIEGNIYDVRDVVLLGCGLEYDVQGTLPLVSRVSVKGGVILGQNISGYTLGACFSF